jgi:hypothetical protein
MTVEQYNEGLLVHVYDQAHGDAIRKANPSVLEGAMEVDDALTALAAEGKLVVFELKQDDELRIEVAVGQPLSERELAKARWHKVQKARLNLPSGRLHVEGANCFQLCEFHDPDEPFEVLDVPPGDYVLWLYRLDWQALENSGLVSPGAAWDGPMHVLALTPSADAEPISAIEPLLFFRP